jgi:hypothetical protein
MGSELEYHERGEEGDDFHVYRAKGGARVSRHHDIDKTQY